jgi:thiazole/oxazole-forming peptide maturase SagD family component
MPPSLQPLLLSSLVRGVEVFKSGEAIGADATFSHLDIILATGTAYRGDKVISSLGAGLDQESRWYSALYELFERSAIYSFIDHTVATASQLAEALIHPLKMGCMNQECGGAIPFRPDIQVAWAPFSVLGAKSGTAYAHRPARVGPDERLPRFFNHSSNGVAAGRNDEDAQLRAILELIERDSFLLHWYLQWKAVPIEPGEDPYSGVVEGWMHERGLDLQIFGLANEFGVVVVLAVATFTAKRGPFPIGGTLYGAACWLDQPGAIRKALSELVAAVEIAEAAAESGAPPSFPRPEVERFALHDMRHHLSFLRDGRRSPMKRCSVGIGNLAQLSGRLVERGMPAAALDITCPEGRRIGVSVQEVIAPGLVPLGAAEQQVHRMVALPRVKQFLAECGMSVGDLHREAHPLG